MFTDIDEQVARAVVSKLLKALDARAAGLWKVEGDALVQVCFVPAEDLDPNVAADFEAATRDVSLARTNLGIVQAFVKRLPAVSPADDLLADSGSGYWLRAFGAVRSIALPWFEGDHGPVRLILSVALPDSNRDADSVVAAIRAEIESFLR